MPHGHSYSGTGRGACVVARIRSVLMANAGAAFISIAPGLCLGPSDGFAQNPGALASEASRSTLDTADIKIQTRGEVVPLRVEIADTAQERAAGLMGRTRLAVDVGMLFLYPQPQPPESGFWMYRTRIPLDIAFLEADGRIAAIRSMTPCASELPSRCPPYLADVEYSAALEVNRGFFARHDIKIGDRVIWPDARVQSE